MLKSVLLQPDPRWEGMIGTIHDLEVRAESWSVTDAVPEEISRMLTVARDLFIYGYFKYELHFVSVVWALFALEASLRDILKGSEATDFAKLIKQGVREKLISERQKEFLDAGRRLRNRFAHPTQQTVITPAMAAETLESTHALISDIYQASSPS